MQLLAIRPDERMHRHVVWDVVRGRVQRSTESAPATHQTIIRVLTTFPSISKRQLELTTEKGELMKSKDGKRSLHIGAAFVSILVTLELPGFSRQSGRPGPPSGADVRSGSAVAETPADHWLLGWTIGVWVDEQTMSG